MSKPVARTSIRRKLLRRTLLVALVPLLFTGAASIAALAWLTGSGKASVSESRAELADEVISGDLSNRAGQLSRELAFFIVERVDDLRELGRDQAVASATADDGTLNAQERLAEFGAAHPDFTNITLADSAGNVVASTVGSMTGSVGTEHWFEEATEAGLDLEDATVDADGLLSVQVAVGLDSGAVVRGALDLSLVQNLADDIATDASREVLVFDAAGRRIADTAVDHDPDVVLNPDERVQLSTDLIAIQAMAFAGHERGTGALILNEVSGGFSFLREDLTVEAQSRADDLLAEEAAEAFDWTVLVEQPTDVAFASLSNLEQLEQDLTTSRNVLSGVVVALLLAAVAAAVVSSLVFGRRLVDPIEKLRLAASAASSDHLPALIQTAQTLEAGDELPALEPIAATTGDELEDLAASIDSIQQTAARLAGEQIELRRRNAAATFVHLGRRNQKLLSSQLESISALEATETNEDTLARLFEVDHLATRMRRNAESLLVMAGEEPPRRWNKPVELRHVVQASIAEVADYKRVEISALDTASVSGEVASNLAHLLAELVENAISFSPPSTTVEIYGLRRPNDGFRLAIVDSGIGLSDKQLLDLNERLADPHDFGDAPSSRLGVFVVGHLAKRYGLTIRLSESALGGVTASVSIPENLLVSNEKTNGDVPPAPEPSASSPDPSPSVDSEVPFVAPAEPIGAVEPEVSPPAIEHDEPRPAPVFQSASADRRGLAAMPDLFQPAQSAPPQQQPTQPPVSAAHAPPSADPIVGNGTGESRWARALERSDTTPPTPGSVPSGARPATTPSGFPMRTKGQTMAGAVPERQPAPIDSRPSRTPEEVQRSLSRYQVGVVLGAANQPGEDQEQPVRED